MRIVLLQWSHSLVHGKLLGSILNTKRFKSKTVEIYETLENDQIRQVHNFNFIRADDERGSFINQREIFFFFCHRIKILLFISVETFKILESA